MNTLRSVVYVSTAVAPMSEAELEALLVEARRLNLETGVTGVLLYSDGHFMQCFEGSEASMEVTYERIRASGQHTGIIELVNDTVAGRSFEEWHMGFKRAKASELLAMSTAQWQRQANAVPTPATESPGLYLLKNFWHRTHR